MNKEIILNNIKYHVEQYGDLKSPALVFLNGVMASTSSWYDFRDYFIEKGYQIILHDFKGQMKSDKPVGPYTFKDHAKETIEILKTLGIEKAHFIGTSYGGEVALNIGFRHPENVLSLTVINSVSETSPKMVKMLNYWKELALTKNGELFFKKMAPTIYGKTYMNANKDFLAKRAQATNSVDPSYFDGQITLYETFIDDVNMTHNLYKIIAKSLIIGSDKDILKPYKFSKLIADNIAHSKLVKLKDVGHVSIFEATEDIIKLIEEHII